MTHNNATKRFLDAGEEPTRTLTPLEGYEKNDLLPLEEAVKPIEVPIHNLNAMVWTAKRNSRNPSDDLTSDESASICLYTMEWPEGYDNFYTILNQKLRSEERNCLKSWFSYLKLFLTALYKLPSIKKTIWRGIHGNVSNLYNEDFIWWGISSCTTTIQAMERFIGRSGERTLFMIECINGKVIKSHSLYQDENEILLMPGTYLTVIRKWSPSDNLYIIHLQEENPPYQLLKSPFDLSSSSVNKSSLDKLPKIQAAAVASHVSHTSMNLHPGQISSEQGAVLFNKFAQESFRTVDGLIASSVSSASQFTKQKRQHYLLNPPHLLSKPTDADSDLDISSDSSFWSDEEEEQQTMEQSQRNVVTPHRRISRHLSTVNRSLLDRTTDLFADSYISQLNRSMRENIHDVQPIIHDTTDMKHDHNQKFTDKTKR